MMAILSLYQRRARWWTKHWAMRWAKRWARLPTYWKVWKMFAFNALQETFLNRGTNALFISGKVIRLGMSLLFLWLIKTNIQDFSGYTPDQVIIFFLTYQLIDVVSQSLFRGVYLFSHQIRSGEFDFILARPINPLFRSLTGKPDINDVVFMVPTLLVSAIIIAQLNVTITLGSALVFLGLLINSLLIVTGLHILVLVVGVLTTEIDGVIWMYRDLSRLGQFPVTIYLEPVRFALFFIIPIGMMITVPAELLLNRPPSQAVAVAAAFGVGFFAVSLWAWRYSLRHYSSASS